MIPLFDLGNVIIRLDFTPFTDWIAREAGCDPSRIMPRLTTSSLWHEFEFGNIGGREFVRRIGDLYGVGLAQETFAHRFCAIFPGVVPGMNRLLGSLLDRGPVYCLTNTNKMHYDFLTKEFREMGAFTRVFASHEIRMRKPWPGTFKAVAEWMEVPPQEVVFFDDVEANVIGARKAGMNAHLFEGAEQVERILEDET
ncbi:MAG: HAD family phosphatase [Bdellovibrionales bacterium]|nr:HAD family phosphatase [Bdellovibrionales bacterium]